jgi:hypothetical protein
MATTLTNFVDDMLVIESIQGALKNALIPLNAFSLGIETKGKVQNDVVRVPYTSAATTAAKTPGTASTSGGAAATKSITLSAYRESSWQLNEGQINASRAPVVFAALAAEATYALAKYVIDLAVAEITIANFATSRAIAAADFSQNDLGILWTDAEGVKMGRDRSCVLNAANTGALIGDNALSLILATMGKDAMSSAKLPSLMGFNIYNYSGLTSPTGENLTGFVCDKAAIGVALAPPEALVGPGEGNKISDEIITDAESSIVCRYIRMADADGGYHKGRVEVMVGVGKILDSLVRIKSA